MQNKLSGEVKGCVMLISILLVLFLISKIYNKHVAESIQGSKYITVAQVENVKLGAKNISIEYKFK